jgi:protein-disulfide isomerase
MNAIRKIDIVFLCITLIVAAFYAGYLFGSRPTIPPIVKVDVSVSDDAGLGDANALVTIIEFSDYECPFCRRHAKQTLPLIKENFIDTGKVRYVFRDFPLSNHPNAKKAAEAAECAGEQGKYWEMHDILFDNQEVLRVENYKIWAADLALAQAAFDACLDSGSMQSEVRQDFEDGQAVGISGTPVIFVNGKPISGAQPYAVFKSAINAALNE